jgi:hypothetical protein
MEIVKYNKLSQKAKENAIWEVNQRNKVAKYKGLKIVKLSIENSLFYVNGVFSGLI